ncbi:MAG: succinate dehydrogenase, cytochrome b556 subunit [Chloroflexi bacterium]|nr:succinate dehydrogenase, cytochrome b556 subunit [Chloroflexota bacterium]
MSSLITTLTESVRYRGREAQWSFNFHRVSGLATLLFLTIHILDTSTVYFFPSLYEHAIAIYRNPVFMVGEMALVAGVIYHGLNGLRIILFDLYPHLWTESRQRTFFWVAFVGTIVLWLPAGFLMGRALLYYSFGVTLLGVPGG